MGPFDAWPTGGGGFEYFYGFIGGENNQWDPALYEGTTPIEPPRRPEEGYHLTEDLADKAIGWIRQQKALMPGQAVLRVLRTRRDPCPAPRAEGVGRQVQAASSTTAGTRSASGRSPARRSWASSPPTRADRAMIRDPAWDDMPDELKPVLRRQMEVYAGFLEHTDHHVGRLVDCLEDLEILDDTLIYYIIGDNGASAEGTLNGASTRWRTSTAWPRSRRRVHASARWTTSAARGPTTTTAVGWAWAMNTPYQWTKQVASHWGGTRNGTIVHWPNGIADPGEIRTQFTHVIDVAPTILEAAGLPEPDAVNGVQQSPIGGHEHALFFNDAEGRGASRPAVLRDVRQPRHLPQGLERGHQAPDPVGDGRWKRAAFDDDVWELYDGNKDWSQAIDLAKEMPESCISSSGCG
jgi:arylsulfatase A-like enzyme